MKKLLTAAAAAISLAAGACTTMEDQPREAMDGLRLAQSRCSACHAIGLSDASTRPDAPPLRDLYQRYAVDDVRRAFSQGIHIGHPDMPTFHLAPDEVDRLVAYLRSIDPCAQPSSDEAALQRCFAPL